MATTARRIRVRGSGGERDFGGDAQSIASAPRTRKIRQRRLTALYDHDRIAGVDEVGRGPWAGPVVASAVILDLDRLPARLAEMIDDSKRLSPLSRNAIAGELPAYAAIGIGAASAAEIDAINILQASMLAMARAVAALPFAPELAIVDGNRLPDLPCPAQAVVGADGSHLAVAAASIMAKVLRDRLMTALAARRPGYGWERNVGYGTAEHHAALIRLGPTRHHRRSFRPIRELMAGCGDGGAPSPYR